MQVRLRLMAVELHIMHTTEDQFHRQPKFVSELLGRFTNRLIQEPAWWKLRGVTAGTVDIVAGNLVRAGASDTAFPELISIRQAASELSVHENTIRNWVDRGLIRAVRLPGSPFRRVPADEVER